MWTTPKLKVLVGDERIWVILEVEFDMIACWKTSLNNNKSYTYTIQ